MTDFLVLSKPRGTLQWVRTDPVSGECAVTSSIDLGGEGGSVAISPDRRHAYVSVREEPAVVTVALDRDGGRLREVGRSATQATVVAVDVAADGHRLYGASMDSHVLLVHAIDAAGVCGEELEALAPGKNAHCVIADPEGDGFWATLMGHDRVVHVARGEGGSRVDEVLFPSAFGPRHLTRCAADGLLYVLGEQTGLVGVVDPRTRTLLRTFSTGAYEAGLTLGAFRARHIADPLQALDGSGLTWCADIKVMPDGSRVFATERTSSVISVNDAEGEVLARVPTEEQPRGIGLDAFAGLLLAVGELSTHATLYRLAPGEGELVPVGGCEVEPGALWVQPLGAGSN